MFKLLKGGYCFTPEKLGKKDILVALDKVYRIEDAIEAEQLWDTEVLDCSDKLVCPGFIDQHVHIIGGGGEEGPVSRIPEIRLDDILLAGETTVVGLLGADGISRSMEALLMKARALEKEGITSYIYSGNYGIPTVTLTGRVISDITLIDKVIGCGEIAIADYRSSHPSVQILKELAYETKMGGLLGGKAGVLHIHVGDGKEGIQILRDLLQQSDFPIEMFVPTHLNRNRELFEQAVKYAQAGGNVDFTAGETSETGYSVPDAIEQLIKRGVDLGRVTVSSDGNGSIPSVSGQSHPVGKVSQLFDDIKGCIFEKNVEIEQALKLVTSNVARILKLFPQKGSITPGADADILVLNQDMGIYYLMAGGQMLISRGSIIKKGRYD